LTRLEAKAEEPHSRHADRPFVECRSSRSSLVSGKSAGCGGGCNGAAVSFIQGTADAAATTVEDVRVDHCGADVAVAEEFLDRADVVAGFEEVGGEGVAQRVAACGLGDACVAHGGLDGALDDRLVQVVAVVLPGVAVAVEADGGKDPLPAPLRCGVWILSDERAGEGGMAATALEILPVYAADVVKMRHERPPKAGGQEGDAILGALAVAHRDLAAVEVDVLDAQPAAFHEPQAGSIHERPHEPTAAGEPAEDCIHFGPGQDDGKMDGAPGANDILQPLESAAEDLLVKE